VTKVSWDVSNPQLRDKAIYDHVHVVKYVVGRITAQLPVNVDREELAAAGIFGLIKAVDRFDPERGVKFETYATTIVRGEVMESLRAKDWAPRSMRRKLRQLAEVFRQLEVQLSRSPKESELVAAIGMTIEDYHRFLTEANMASVASLDEVLAGEEPEDVTDRSPWADPQVLVAQADQRRLIAEAVDRLPERTRRVLYLYCCEGLTLKRAGERIGVSESRVSQIITEAAGKIRRVMRCSDAGIPLPKKVAV